MTYSLSGLTSMAERVKQVVKVGSWLYDGTVESHVQIVKQNYFELPEPEDEESTPGYPPRDKDGNYYYEYFTPGAGKGLSNLFGSAEDAIQNAIETLRSPIEWDQ